ncbi:MAG: hypothetical protein M3132_13720 [Actinomycetia bacterium]|nr:hypothetical protein [Actinomycetes bacterium]
MSKTSSRLPVCVHCGTARPADETLCPTCGKPWIDTTITSEIPTEAPEVGTADDDATGEIPIVPPVPLLTDDAASEVDTSPSDLSDPETDEGNPDDTEDTTEDLTVDDDSQVTEEIEEIAPIPIVAPPPTIAGKTDNFAFDDWTEETADSRRVMVWVVPILIAAVAAAVWLFIFLDGDSSPIPTTVVASPTTVAPTSTVPDSTTSTDASTPTTTIPAPVAPPPDAWPPKGDALDAAELPLKASGIGPLDLGMPIADVAGVLTASFGTANATGTDDVCKPEESYWLQWGDLRAIFDGHDPDATFVSFRNETTEHSDTVLGISTLSGLAIGDTVKDLINTYPSYTVSFEVIDSVNHFRLVQGGELLLWGPVTSSDLDGIVEGIYSPSPCPTS